MDDIPKHDKPKIMVTKEMSPEEFWARIDARLKLLIQDAIADHEFDGVFPKNEVFFMSDTRKRLDT
jgi:hypothetical protein